MSDLQMRDLSEADIIPMTEEEFAHYHKARGTKVVLHNNRYWKETYPGFYQPLHWMARLNIEQATPPPQWHWGFQGSLREEDETFANGYMPVHLLSDVASYDLESLSSNRRYQVRKSLKRSQIVQLNDSSLLQEQGYEVLCSALKRTQHSKILSKIEYLEEITNDYIPPKHRLILAALIDNKLVGYFTGYAINETADIERVYLATEALSVNIGTALAFEFGQVCRRLGKIREIVYGTHSKEDAALCTFKESLKFPVTLIPVKVEMNPIMEKFIRWRYPHKYYRLTGKNL